MKDKLSQRILDLSNPLDPIPTGQPNQIVQLDGVQAVLFDIYGTLFISGSGDISVAGAMDHSEALFASLMAVGLSAKADAGVQGHMSLRERVSIHHGKRKHEGLEYPEVDIRVIWKEVLEELKSNQLLEGPVSEETILLLAVEYECRVNPVWPMPGLKKVLLRLKEAGIQLGIVSNSQFFTPLLFEAFLGASYEEAGFDRALCSWSYECLEAKPSTRLFADVCEALREKDIAPAACLYVGNDMLNDMWPASQLGFKTVLFAGDNRSLRLRENDSRCLGVEPNIVIDDLEKIGVIL